MTAILTSPLVSERLYGQLTTLAGLEQPCARPIWANATGWCTAPACGGCLPGDGPDERVCRCGTTGWEVAS